MALKPHNRVSDLTREGYGSPSTIWRWIKLGLFPPGRLIGPNIRVWSREEVREWFENRPTAKKTELPASPRPTPNTAPLSAAEVKRCTLTPEPNRRPTWPEDM
jgi:Prophage CP4-57 regulatory protein (AlpA)